MAYLDIEGDEDDDFILCTTNKDVKEFLYDNLDKDYNRFKDHVYKIIDVDFSENIVKEKNFEERKKIYETVKYQLVLYSHCTKKEVYEHMTSITLYRVDKQLIKDVDSKLVQIDETRKRLKQIIKVMKKVVDIDSEEERRKIADHTIKKIVTMSI